MSLFCAVRNQDKKQKQPARQLSCTAGNHGGYMMKILNTAVSVLLAFSLCSVRLPVQAAERPTDQCGDHAVWSFDGRGKLTVSGSGDLWDFGSSMTDTDPDNQLVREVPWGYLCTDIRQVCFEGDITGIGRNAFEGMPSLETVQLPASLKTIGEGAFFCCNALSDIALPDGLTEIASYALSYTALTDITLPDSVRTLGVRALSDNASLTAIRLNDGLLEIGDCCFSSCPVLTDIKVPDSVERIGSMLMEDDIAWYRQQQNKEFAMLGDSFLYRCFTPDSEIVIPEGVRHIDGCCFSVVDIIYDENIRTEFIYEYARSDIRSVTLPDSLTELPAYLFSGCEALKSVHFGAGVRTIPPNICSGCRKLESVTLPDGLLTISAEAFSGCRSLYQLRIPDTVQSIGADAFRGTAWLESADELLICGDGVLVQYSGDRNILTLPEGVRTVCTHAFLFSKVVSLTLPDSFRTADPDAFESSYLTEIILNDGLTEIPAGTFRQTLHLSELRIPESVTEISPDCIQSFMHFTVTGTAGSAAERFAKQAGLQFTDENRPAGPDRTLRPEKDCWSFRNSTDVFGTQMLISDEDNALLDTASLAPGAQWDGACFGMCATVILAKSGVFSPRQIDSRAKSLHDLAPTFAVKSMINCFHCLQQTEAFRNYLSLDYVPQTVFRMIRTAQQIPKGAPPFMICFNIEQKNRHAIVGYGIEHGSWNYMNRSWSERILTYDPNAAGGSDEVCVYYDPEVFAVCIPQYGFFWDSTVSEASVYLKICNDTDVLNCLPYPFAERFQSAMLPGDVNGDGSLNAGDVTLLLDALLCKSVLSDDAAARADITGDGRLTAADLAVLKQSLL